MLNGGVSVGGDGVFCEDSCEDNSEAGPMRHRDSGPEGKRLRKFMLSIENLCMKAIFE